MKEYLVKVYIKADNPSDAREKVAICLFGHGYSWLVGQATEEAGSQRKLIEELTRCDILERPAACLDS